MRNQSKSPSSSSGCNPLRALITGGTGYLGAGLARQLALRDWDTISLSRSGSRCATLEGNTIEIEADICHPDVWLRNAEGVDAIVHLAAQTSTYVANQDPVADELSNVRPMVQLLETCRREGWKPFIVFASTVTVVGMTDSPPVNEEQRCYPVTVYDLHKWMAEQYLELYCRLGYARGTVLRLSNVYGPGPKSGQKDRGILNYMIRNALTGKPLTLYGTGEWLRDYVFIDDVVSAFVSALEHQETVNGKHWIIARGQSHTMREAFQIVADQAARTTGSRVTVEHVDLPAALSPIEQRNFVADVSAFSNATGWRPEVSLKEGIERTIEALRHEGALVTG